MEFSKLFNDEGSLKILFVLATASRHNLQNMFPMAQPSQHHWTGACKRGRVRRERERKGERERERERGGRGRERERGGE